MSRLPPYPVALIVLAALALTAAGAIASKRGTAGGQAVVVRSPAGKAVARLDLPRDRRFALEYRNSLYEVAAEERFRATRNGTFHLVSLAADRVAVLEEYYRADGRAVRALPGDRRAWRQDVARPPRFTELRVAATALGRRTVIVGRKRLALWRLVPDGSVVTLAVESNR